jgi:predicted ATPase
MDDPSNEEVDITSLVVENTLLIPMAHKKSFTTMIQNRSKEELFMLWKKIAPLSASKNLSLLAKQYVLFIQYLIIEQLSS